MNDAADPAACREARMGDEARALASDPRHIARAVVVARSLARRCDAPRDLLESAALVGLCHAARDYDRGRGTCFRTLADRRIAGEVLDEARRWSHSRRACQLRGHSLDVDDGAEVFESGEAPPGEPEEFHDFVSALTRDLPPRAREVVRMAYLDCRGGDGLRGVAAALGVSLSLVHAVHGEAMRQIRSRLGSTRARQSAPPCRTTQAQAPGGPD